MSDYDFPELPSDEELGITDEDRKAYEEAFGDERPELSEAEQRALLGDVPAPAGAKGGSTAGGKQDAKAEKKAKQATKAAAKENKRRLKEAKKAERAAARAKKAGAKAAGAAGAGAAEAAAAGAEKAGPSGPKPGAETTAPGAPKAADEAAKAGAGRFQRQPDGPRSRWRGVATLAVMLAASWVASPRTGLPRPQPANAPDTEFSSSRAMSTLIEIASAPHPPGSPEHERVRTFLVDRLASMGLEPQVQTTTVLQQSGTTAEAATVRNVVARLPGTDPTGAVLMMAHYDGRGLSFAAGDDASGVVAILESVRAIQAEGPLRNDLIILLTDGEELGLFGASAFVDEHPWMADVSLVLNFDMRGSAGPSIMFETNDLSGWVVRAMATYDSEPFANSIASEVYRRLPNDTDFTPFKEAGVQGLNFAAIGNGHVYHQEYDEPESLSEATLQHHGVHALGAARYFGDADLTEVNAPDVVYFTVPLFGLIVYDTWVAPALSGALLLLLAAAFFGARRAGARPWGLGIGVVVSLAGSGAAFGAAYTLTRWLPRFHGEAGSLLGSSYHAEGWYVIAVAAMAFTAVTGLHGIARRWFSALELTLGGLVVPLLAAVALGFVAPLAAMNLQWPVVAGVLAAIIVALLGDRFDKSVGWVAALVLALPVLFLLNPVTELVWQAIGFGLAPAVGVVAAITLYLCLPAVEALRHPNVLWAPLTSAVVALAAVGLGVLTTRPNARRPAPSTLVYAYEHGTGAAVWATDAAADSLDAEATAWAVTRAGGSFEGTRDLSSFGYLRGQSPTVPAPVVSAAPPEVILARDTIEGSIRHVTLRVRSRIGAEYLGFTYDGVGDTRLLSIDGRAIENPAELTWLGHWGAPDPAVVLELEMPQGQAIGLHVIEHLLRPEELLGEDAFRRPPDLAPDVTRLSDRAMFRYSVGAFADPRHAILLPGRTPTAPTTPAAPPPAAPADTLLVPRDTMATDTLATDTTAAPTDTVQAGTDPIVTIADTLAVGADTSAVQPVDTTAIRPDTVSTAPTAASPRHPSPAHDPLR